MIVLNENEKKALAEMNEFKTNLDVEQAKSDRVIAFFTREFTGDLSLVVSSFCNTTVNCAINLLFLIRYTIQYSSSERKIVLKEQFLSVLPKIEEIFSHRSLNVKV